MTDITLTPDQDAALDKFVQFLMDPTESVFVLEGYSGTGKSTLVATLLDRLPGYIQTAKLINPEFSEKGIQLTATTHKAAENFERITGMDVVTIHSFLGLRIQTDYQTGAKTLAANEKLQKFQYLIFVDEASMIDSYTLGLIFKQAQQCKIVFIGDPAQLPPVKVNQTPVFNAGFPTARLSQVMRQQINGKPAINPITELATAFRHTVETGEWPVGFKPDGHYVSWLPRNDFMAAIEQEFVRDDWTYAQSKILAWTNNTVIAYNKHVRAMLKGDPSLQVGDYAENNSHIQMGKDSIKTDQTVCITAIEPEIEVMGVPGNFVVVDHHLRIFHPKERGAKNKLATRLRAEGRFSDALEVDNWIDLRAVFAQTINKSQGSTYGKVFIDLDDISRCNMGNLMARLLYVAISRAQSQVILTGDINK